MGSCNTIDEQVTIKIRRNRSKVSDEAIRSDSDYIINKDFINHSNINQKYKLSKSVGTGATGIVCIGTDKLGKQYAIKRINKKLIQNKNLLFNEAKISLLMDHEHIIKTYEIYEDLKTISFIMDLVDGGDLFSFISKSPDNKLDDNTSLNLIIQILETLYYLHEEMNIVHRDIKPENLLVEISNDGTPKLKLIDFGFACEIKDNLKENLGTPMYTAPEIILGKEYNEKVDIWSTGILFFNLLTGTQPYNTLHYIPLDEQIVNNSIPYSKISNEKFKTFIKKLLNKNPDKRLNAKDALDIAYDLRDEIEKCELLEQFEQLDSEKEGKIPLQYLKKYFNLNLEDNNNRKVDFEEFYNIVMNSVKVC